MSRQDMDIVLNDGIKAAVHFIEKRGEFYPFGVVKTNRGEVRHIQALTEDSCPTSDIISESLKTSLREGGISGKYETVAIVSNIEFIDKEDGHTSDAISISIDDRSSEPILCYIPYNIVQGSPVLGDIKAGAGIRIAFDQ